MNNDQSLNIIITAQDKATKTLNNFKSNVEKMKPAFQKMAVVGTAAFTGIAAAVGTSVAAFAKSQAQLQLVDSALDNVSKKGLKTFVGGLEEAKFAARDYGAQVQALGGIADEEAALSFAQLLQITQDQTKAYSAADTALDLATAKQIDLGTATDIVGKVLSGNIGILERYGIAIAENATIEEAMIAINEKFGGSYAKQGQTIEGQTKILKESFGDLQEVIGEAFVPVLTKLLETIGPLLIKITEWAEANPELVVRIAAVALAVTALVAGIGFLGLALPLIIAGFTLLLGPIGLVAVAIGAITIALFQASEMMQWTSEDWAMTWEGIKITTKEAVNFLIGLAEAYANSWVKAANVIIKALNSIKISIPSWVPGIGGKSFSINLPTIPEIALPRFEHGGIVPGPEGRGVPIMAHGGEEIIPARSARSGSGNFTIIINNPVVRNRDDLAAMRKQMEDAFRDVSRGHKLSTI